MNRRGFIAIAIILTITLLVSAGASAAEKESFGTKCKNFWKRLVNYPANVTKESGETVATAAKNTTRVVSQEAKDLASVASGELGKTPDLVVNPVKGTAETVGTAVKDTVMIPVNAAKEESKPAAQSK